MRCPLCGAVAEQFWDGQDGPGGPGGQDRRNGHDTQDGPGGPGGPAAPGAADEREMFRAYEPPPVEEDLWVSRTMTPGAGADSGGPSAGSSGPPARRRLLITVAVVALGCLGAAAAVVAGTGGGGDAGRDAAGPGQPPRVGSPELPGLGGAVTPGPGEGAGGSAGEGADAGEGSGEGEAGGAAPGPGATTAAPSPSGSGSGGGHGPGAGEWAGPGCTTGTYREHGRFENGKAAWYTVTKGGYKGATCDGRFSAVPMSGSPDIDRGSTAVWSWKLDASYEKCALAIYVPDSGHDADAAGDPTVYQVLADPADGTSGYRTFGVRQTAHRGSLVPVGSYPVKGKTFSVRLVDRGQDWGSQERFGAHHAAAQMKVTCA
ncbi:adhesin [Streptomyces sp. NPDC059142]|uniref:adhesin n=1 Tax=Streptomyces sp. NPDC059142 TaxID=3346739 RepID=UPI00367AB3A9